MLCILEDHPHPKTTDDDMYSDLLTHHTCSNLLAVKTVGCRSTYKQQYSA